MVEDASGSRGDRGEVSETTLRDRWEEAPSDPDLFEDLDYELEKLDLLVTSNSDKKVMVLPRAEEWVREDAYLIADIELACDPIDRA